MTGKRRKNLRSSQKKSSKLVNNQRKYCLKKTNCHLNEENSSILNEENSSILNEENCSSKVEMPTHEDETHFDPFRVKIRSLISNVSSYVATMEINIFHNWSCLAPESQDIFGMLEGAVKLSCFLEEKFYALKDDEVMELEVENIKYIYCRSKIIIYIIKNILGKVGYVHDEAIYKMIVISEVNRHIHLIKKFGLKLPMDCSILKTEKNKLSFSDFTVMIESDLGTFSLRETEKIKGILKKPAGEICKASFPISFLEEKRLKSYETQFSQQSQNFEETQIRELEMQNIQENKLKRKLRAATVNPSPKRLSIENSSNELSSTTSFDGTSLLIPTISDNHSEKKKKRYNKKLKATSTLSSNESILRKSSLGSEIASCSGTSLLFPANSDNHLGKEKRVYNKKRKEVDISEEQSIHENNIKRRLRAVTSTAYTENIANNLYEPSLDSEINNIPGTSSFIAVKSKNHLTKKKRAYNKKHKETEISEYGTVNIPKNKIKRKLRATSSTSKKLNIGNNLEESSLGSEITVFPATPVLFSQNSDSQLEKKKKMHNKIFKDNENAIAVETISNVLVPSNDDGRQEEIESKVSITSSDDDKQEEIESKVSITSSDDDKQEEIESKVSITSSDDDKQEEIESQVSITLSHDAKQEEIKSKVSITSSDDAKQEEIESQVSITLSHDAKQEEIESQVSITSSDDAKQEEIESQVSITLSHDAKQEEIESQVSITLSDDVRQEEIEFGGEVTISSYDIYCQETEYSEGADSTNANVIDEVSVPSVVIIDEIDKEGHEPTNVNVISEVSISNNITTNEIDKEGTKLTNVIEADEILTPVNDIVNEVDEDKNEIPVDTISKVSVPLYDEVKQEEIEFGGEVIISSYDIYDQETEYSEKINEVVLSTTDLEKASEHTILSGSTNLEATSSTSSPKTLNNQKITSKSLLHSEITITPQTAVLVPTNLENNVVKKKRKYTKKQKVDVCNEIVSKRKRKDVCDEIVSKRKRKVNTKSTKLEDSFLPPQSLETEQVVKDKPLNYIAQIHNVGEAARKIDSNLLNKLEAKSSVNVKKYKKSVITIPATKISNSDLIMDIKIVNNEDKNPKITEGFMLKKDKQSIQQSNEILIVEQENKVDQHVRSVKGENKVDQEVQSAVQENKVDQDIQCLMNQDDLGYEANSVDITKSINPKFLKISEMDFNIDIEVPSKNLEEPMTNEKKNDFFSGEGFSVDTLEKIIKVIDDPSYEGNDLKKTLSSIINKSRLSRSQNDSKVNPVIHEDNDIKTSSIGNLFNSNPNYNCEVTLQNEVLNTANSSQIKNTSSDFHLSNKNTYDGKNNVTDTNLGYNSRSYLDDSLDINSNKIDSNAVETTPEELMNTEQFLKNSIDIDYSQNVMPTNANENDLNSVSLAKITKCQYFIGNRVTSAKSLDLNFSDLSWA